MPKQPLPAEDLAHVAALARDAFVSLAGACIFLTGGTGFFGHWLLESLLHANDALHLHLRATVLTRNAAAFRANSPHIANATAITLLEGDIQTFAFPAEPHTHILHAATDTTGGNSGMLATSIVEGTRRVLEFARHTGAQRLLYTSTGAVYGRSTTLPHTPEIFLDTRAPVLAPGSYESAKRAAELLCLGCSDIDISFARCFAFVGPRLPLDAHFAIGNFIRDALAGSPIHIQGDGTPRRSYLYMSDLAFWLWTMLAKAPAGRAYNVGSDQSVSIAELAQLTADTLRPGLPIQIDGAPTPGAPLNSYVPDITLVRNELGLAVTVPLAEAIRRTAVWCRD